MAEENKRLPDGPLSLWGAGVIGATILVDQISKLVAERSLPLEQPFDLLPFLSLYRVHNTGIAFSLFSDFGSAGLIVLTLVVTAIILFAWQRSSEGGRMAAIGYGLIIGGAIGNLIDRFAYGHVVDFLFLHWGSHPLFVFNLADTALTIGPALLILTFLLMPSEPRAS